MKRIEKSKLIKYSCVILLAILSIPLRVYAADGTITFGSNWYEKEFNEEFNVGVYIRSEETVGQYEVEISYDPRYLQYVSGASEVDETMGIMKFSGTSNAKEEKLWLTFHTLSGGNTQLSVKSAAVDNSQNEKMTINDLSVVEVRISGEDIVSELENKDVTTDSINENQESETIANENVTNISSETKTQGEVDSTRENEEKGSANIPVKGILCLFIAILLALLCSLILLKNQKVNKIKKKRKMKKKIKNIKSTTNGINDINMIDFDDIQKDEMPYENVDNSDDDTDDDPVIRVEGVTMRFKIATSNTSGIKDFIIQKIKRQVSYREFMALDDVSFNVYRGEVIGIIGTNGAGKSTLLKIVSGALVPTKGRVVADKSKIQLLTLGTGFDGELTAKENVYLNGAIIGYSKEFLDSHYDEIVEFAELEGFMEEKVKNFSSGMVSRLGFAIATVGDAAEILILDEVLSVGDEFFRKKSLNRVKEMIHGGSTVLMVSHSINTILDNCTKAVWIEKGKLQMVGEPQYVCKQYRNIDHEKKEKI